MQRTLLKLLAFSLLEKTCRFTRILDDRGHDKNQLPPALMRDLRKHLTDIQQAIIDTPDLFETLFNPKAKATISLHEFLNNTLYPQYADLCQASEWLHQWGLNRAPELGMFLSDAVSTEDLMSVGYRVVSLHPEGDVRPKATAKLTNEQAKTQTPIEKNAMIERLSVLDIMNPLAWPSLSFEYALKLASSDEAKNLRQQNRIQSAMKTYPDGLKETLLAHAVGLRLHGPSYYFNTIIHGFFTQDTLMLSVIEPLLFNGLGHIGGLDKQALLLHEGIESHKAVLLDAWQTAQRHENTEKSALPPASPLNADVMGAFFAMAEKLVPDRDAFTDRHVERVLALQEALHQHTLISAKAVYPHQAAYEQLTQVHDTDTPIYTNLNLVTHTPNSPREIVNAGWMYHMERLPIWLFDTLSQEQHATGIDGLGQRLARQDFLLTKSIETSEIHRVLLTPAEPSML